MRWFGRKAKPRFRPFDKSMVRPVAPPNAERALEEGLVLAEYTARMTLKNDIIVETLKGGDDFVVDHFVDEAAGLYRELGDDQEHVARQIGESLTAAEDRVGKARHPHDYRTGDTGNLEKRRRVADSLAGILRSRADDPEAMREAVWRAREDAWREVSAALGAALDAYAGVEAWRDDYERERPERLRRFLREDLERLEEQRGGY